MSSSPPSAPSSTAPLKRLGALHLEQLQCALAPKKACVKLSSTSLGMSIHVAEDFDEFTAFGHKRPRSGEILDRPTKTKVSSQDFVLTEKDVSYMACFASHGDTKLLVKVAHAKEFLVALPSLNVSLPTATLGFKAAAWISTRVSRGEIQANTGATYLAQLGDFLRGNVPDFDNANVCNRIIKGLKVASLLWNEASKANLIPLEDARTLLRECRKHEYRAAFWLLCHTGGRWADLRRADLISLDLRTRNFGVDYNLMKNHRTDCDRVKLTLSFIPDFDPDPYVVSYLSSPELWPLVKSVSVGALNSCLSSIFRHRRYTTKSFRMSFHNAIFDHYTDEFGVTDWNAVINATGHGDDKAIKAYQVSSKTRLAQKDLKSFFDEDE